MGTSGIHIADPQDGTPADVISTAPVSDTGQAGLAVRVISQLGGSSGGAAVTVADGADVALGAVADVAWSSGSGTVIGLLKKLAGLLAGTLTVGTHAVTQSGTFTVQPGNTANTTAWKVDGSAVTQPVSGTFFQATQPVSIATAPVLVAGTAAIGHLDAPTTIYNGKKTVTTAGTRVTLASSQAIRSVVIKALYGNTGTIYVGDGSVASTTGVELLAGDSVGLDIANLATVNLDSSVNGEGVTYIATN